MTKQRYTITTALPYANGPLHLGHVAGVYIPADIYVRYLRAKNEDVIFIGGTDEHGVPITIKAKNEGVTPQQVVDKYHNIIDDSLKQLGITLDIFSKTTSKTHYKTASDLFKKLEGEGAFTEEVTEQYYDEENKQFLADRYITGTCPHCANEKAYGDQCEKCGTTLNATDLINPRSALSGNKPVLKQTKHWFLPLDHHEEWLKTWILEGHQDWKSNVYGQCKSWLEAGLHPRAITRDLDWGIPVPVAGGEGKVLYVWFDAPIGYISFTQELLANDKNRKWEDYWKKDGKSKLIHFIGKDNIVFHCIIFPSMLKLFGDYILPDNVPANEFLNLEGDKFSTSGNWAVWLHEFLADFPDKTDVLRYTLCSNMPETKDADFTWKDFQAKNNNELADNLGNFVNRAFVLTHKFFNGFVPALANLKEIDENTLEQAKEFNGTISESLNKYRFREALSELMKLSSLGNKYLADTEPWKIKDNPERVGTILRVALEIAAKISVLGSPFLPETSQKISSWLGISNKEWSDAERNLLLTNGFVIATTPQLLFSKIEDDVIAAQLEKLKASKLAVQQAKVSAAPQKENVSFEDFSKMDIRVGTIIEAEKVPKTAKLLKLKIDTGIDQRTVVSGIAEHYNPEDIIGKQVSILVNLAPRNIKGIESQGMILMAENSKGELAFVSPEKVIDNGGGVR
ncbi:MAG: methionine--tRNA ligase [Bacteroidetes bacterium]|nr:methionine--tRNA ligase [Bacteroidota bacterium]